MILPRLVRKLLFHYYFYGFCSVICMFLYYNLLLVTLFLVVGSLGTVSMCMCVLSRQSELSALKKKSLAQRTLMELVQLMSPAVESEGDGEGRQSGSLEWRLARSETTVTTRSYVWTPTSQEVSIFSFNLLMCLHFTSIVQYFCSVKSTVI